MIRLSSGAPAFAIRLERNLRWMSSGLHACRCRSGRGHSFLRRNYLSREPEDDSISRAHFVLENAILWWLMFPKGPPSNDRIPKSFNPGLDVRDFNGGLQIGVDARNPNFKSRSD